MMPDEPVTTIQEFDRFINQITAEMIVTIINDGEDFISVLDPDCNKILNIKENAE